MKDVFKFLKDSRNLLESAASEKADELGYEHRSNDVYLDPKTGKRFKFDNNRFVEYDLPPRMAAGYEKNEPEIPVQNRDYPAFKKDASRTEKEQQTPSVTDQNARNTPGGPDEKAFESGDIERIAMMYERGRPVTPERHKENLVRAQQELDTYNQEQEALATQAEEEAAAEVESEQEAEAQAKADEHKQLVKDAGEPEKTESDYRTVDKVIVDNLEENGQNFDGSITQGDVDIATEESIQRVTDISNTDVEDQRFDDGRESQKEFLDHYSKDSENRKGLDALNSLATANNREKVDQLMEAVNNGDYEEEINITQKDKRSVSQILLDAGIDVNDQAQMDCFKNAHKEINNFVDGKGKFKTSESSELTGSNLGHYEAKHIEKRNDLSTMDAAGVQTKGFNLRNDSESNMQCVTPTITDAVYNLLPKPARDELAKSGSPKKFYDPRVKNRQGTANPIRGSAALHMWVMQDGKDAYAAAGRRRSPGEFQVEHIVPLKSGGKDEIENFSMLLRRVNEPRADLSFKKFLEQAAKKANDIMADLSNPKTRDKMERAYRSSKFNDYLAPNIGGAASVLLGDDLMTHVNNTLDSNLGKKAATPLKVKPEDFKKYQEELKEHLDKNGLDENSLVTDMTGDQMNGIFDIMQKHLSVDKSKMFEYMGRNSINNYDVGGRTVINKEGELERGRGGTQSSSGNLTNMQNTIMSDDSFDLEERKSILKEVNKNHQKLKNARNNFIDNKDSPEAYENYLASTVDSIGYLIGDGNSPLSPDRKYDTRMTPSVKNTLDDDTLKGIIGMMTLDSSSISKSKDAFSPAWQKTPLTPKAKEHVKTLRKMMVDAYSRTSGLTPEQIENPDSLKADQRKKLAALTNALENIDRGLAQ